ncbi:MAG TPA: arylsulfotransferase family protein [Solirubrobacteraceae bacterium]|nr:arylsulfotransferase family protein [Solirubrobacteraceae bacterium]
MSSRLRGARRAALAPAVLAAVLGAICTGGLASAAAATHKVPASPRCTPSRLNTSDVLPGTSLAVSPVPDSYDAPPATQISMVGVPSSEIASVRVSGSSTGGHGGKLRAYSQGDGASFVPSSPFAAGETVTVSGTLRTPGHATPFRFHFVTAHEDVIPYAPGVHRIADPNEKQHFHSAPLLEPPLITVTARSPQTAPGYLFASPYNGPGPSGPMIFDESGSLVWFAPEPAGTEATNLQVQQLGGRPVLTWWQGYIPAQGFGEGEDIILNAAYKPVGRVHAGNGLKADLHDFHITPQATALVTVFNPVQCNLSGFGGPATSAVTDSIYQEIDLNTGLVRREWHSIDHVPFGDSYNSPASATSEWPFDFFHLNSLQQIPGEAMLISARNTWTVYELDTATGQIAERIGGKHSDVAIPGGAGTAFQHDATLLPNGTISIFDNGAEPKVHTQSRGLVVSLPSGSTTEALIAEYRHPSPLLSGSQGDIQQLENGDEFVGWGSEPYFSEFGSGGQLLFDAHMQGSYQSYRAYRFPWTGAPTSRPAIAAGPRSKTAPVTVFASWNGDTRTATWQLFAGGSPTSLKLVASAARSGFETAIQSPGAAPWVAVRALDASGRIIGASLAIPG